MDKRKSIFVFDGTDEMFLFLANKWREIGRKAIAKKGKFTVALSGGKTPARLYKRLAQAKNMPHWGLVHLFQSDERFVSRNHPDSNYRMIERSLLKHVPLPAQNIHPVVIDKTARISAQIYQRHMEAFFKLRHGKLPQFDLIMLGIGEDGHTASIFSKEDISRGRERLAIATNPRHFNYSRISLTLPLINNAGNVLFVVKGPHKAAVVKDISTDKKIVPASMVKPKTGQVFIALDRDAASRLY